MEWHSRTSYRNGRLYDEGPPTGPVSSVRLTIAWMLLIIRQRLAKLTIKQRPGSILFKSGDSRGFTLLGGESEHGSTIPCPFPQRNSDGNRPRSAPCASAEQIDRWAEEVGAVAARKRKEADQCSQH